MYADRNEPLHSLSSTGLRLKADMRKRLACELLVVTSWAVLQLPASSKTQNDHVTGSNMWVA